MAGLFRRRPGGDKTTRTPPPELVAEARRHAGGWVYEIDATMVDDPDGEVPPTAIVGGWEVSRKGTLTGVYMANPNYAPDAAGRRRDE
ncbi:hypothetical protein [Streptomyces sp. MAR4 CNX-425]|uniref:hypothetical protein n=1 Tax=Streptomyces sp. MAR4 CNX-425 TaxID=3406343 RepID=UPI003B507D68